ncbi:pyridoxal phosphate-dependent transferase [Trichoderma austrokoningii]
MGSTLVQRRNRLEGEVEDDLKLFGGQLKRDFLFAPRWRNINHGSFGSIPRAIQDRLRYYQDKIEARPGFFVRHEHGKLNDESRDDVAMIINVPVETITFVNNATEGVNTVFKNMKWYKDGRDVVYDACVKTIDFHGQGKFTSCEIKIWYPIEDEAILQRFHDAIKQVEAEGKRAKICIFDIVSSNPGLVFSWEAITKAYRELGVLSLVDGAQGIGRSGS